jgi:hypothetical protein
VFPKLGVGRGEGEEVVDELLLYLVRLLPGEGGEAALEDAYTREGLGKEPEWNMPHTLGCEIRSIRNCTISSRRLSIPFSTLFDVSMVSPCTSFHLIPG